MGATILVNPRLMASYFTIAGAVAPLTGSTASPHSLAERVSAAADAGFVGIGLSSEDLDRVVAQHDYAGVRSILDDCGIRYLELEVLLDWFADGERRARSDAERVKLMKAAERLGVYQIKVGGDITGTVWPLERMIESFANLARQAGDAGTMVTLEVFPDSNVRDLPTAVAIADGANPAHGGLLIDIWHMARGGIPYDDVSRLPLRYIKHVEIDDADAEVVGTIMEDTLDRRRLPGQGALDVPAFLTAIAATGYDGLYGVEILSEEMRRMVPREAAQAAYSATMAQFERAADGLREAAPS